MEARELVRSSDPDVIIHAWAPSRTRINPPAYIPAKVVAKKAKEITLRPAGALGKRRRAWKASEVYGGEHRPGGLTVVGDLSQKDMKAVVVYALEFEDMLMRQVGGAPQGIPYRIKIFANEKEFREVASKIGAQNALSYYSPRTRDIVGFFSPKQLTTMSPSGAPVMTHDDLQSILAHEFTHAYTDIVWGGNYPLWFAEGIAEYYQHFEWRGDRAIGGALNEREIKILSNNTPLPLGEFVEVPRDRMYGPEFPQLYAQAWAVVHYLQTYHPRKVMELLSGEKVDVRGLDREWTGHFSEMKRASVG